MIFDDARAVIESAQDFSFLERKTVLLTGTTGLIGTHFLATLALLNELGLKMRVISQCHSFPPDLILEISERGGISLVMGDADVRADVILHCAGFAQPLIFTANPVETIRINTTVTQRLLENLKPGGKFLFISSSEVYSGLSGVVDESQIGTTTPSHPRSSYIEGKRCGEAIVNAYRQGGVNAKSVRLSLTYGPGTRKNDKRALSSFINKALTKGKIKMEYPGLETRSYCYIRDAVEMMWKVLLHGTKPVYNIGGPDIITMLNLAKLVGQITGVEVTAPEDSQEMAGANGVLVDVSRYKSEFPKKDFVKLEAGVKNTIDWQRGFYAI